MALTILAGMKLTPTRLNRLVPVTAAKAADATARTNNTQTADPDLGLALKAGMTYELGGLLIVTSAADNVGDFAYAWSWTNTATVTMGPVGGNNGITTGSSGSGEWIARSPDSTSPTTAIPYFASTTPSGVIVTGRVVVGASDSTLTLTWAQNTTNPSGTTLKAGSYIVARPIDGSI